jgi:glycosyltransferase involved in cell wall biosynthesis
MRLLVVNFEMDRLSRTMPWSQQIVNRLAQACEVVVVLTSRVGLYDSPPNVYVEVIPARPFGVPGRLGSQWLVNFQVVRLVRRYRLEVCFVHMAAGWAYRLSPCFRLLNIPVLVWYAHGTVNEELRRAHKAAIRVVTSTPEGFRIPSNKVRVIGQGVDTELFNIQPRVVDARDILSVTRISPRKRIELLLEVIRHIKEKAGLRLRLIGTTITPDDQQYEIRLRDRMWRLGLQDSVEFVGFVPQEFIPYYYRASFLHLNVSQTGSMDKTVIEALACGCPVLTSNDAFFELLKDYPEFIIRDDRPEAIVQQVLVAYSRREQYDPQTLRRLVAGKHDMDSYIQKLLNHLHEVRYASSYFTDQSTSSS